jgi:NDP-sugar pyrophosphorylase family protein
MQINHCLILAAGFGTRMGKIGEKLPKVMWPIFEKSLLHLQVAYAKSLGINNIFINLHYMGDEIFQSCKNDPMFENVQFLWEKPEILDIGGAIHHLASQTGVKYKGRLLVLNADQFFYISKEEITNYLQKLKQHPNLLFTYEVNSSHGYNALEIDEDRMVKRIIPNKELNENAKIETYTGISLVDLSKLEPISGKSAFFESVCNFHKNLVPTVLLKNIDYWDFGTVNRYWDSMHRLLVTYKTQATHPFVRFLINQKALKSWKIDLQNLSYNSKSAGVINLGPEVLEIKGSRSIVLSGRGSTDLGYPFISWNDIVEQIK